VTQPPAKYN